MNKICTSLEQSKKLVELGIDVDTSDMVYLRSYFEEEGEYNLLVGSYHEGYMEKDNGGLVPVFDEHISAWSLSALLDILPLEIDLHKQSDGNIKYYIEYTTKKTYFASKRYTNLIDAVFEIVCWLKENGKI